MKRECEKLMKLMERRKTQFMQEIENKYLTVANTISNAVQECKVISEEGLRFADFVSLVLKEDDNLVFAQVNRFDI